MTFALKGPSAWEQHIRKYTMKRKEAKKGISAAEYYDTHGALKDIVEEEIDLSLDDQLREAIITVRRKNKGPLPTN